MTQPNPVNTAAQGLISTLSGALSGLSPFAKAIVPGVSGVVGSFVTMAFSGTYNWPSIEVAGIGVLTSLVVYLVPNIEKKTPAPPAVAPAPAPAPANSGPKAA